MGVPKAEPPAAPTAASTSSPPDTPRGEPAHPAVICTVDVVLLTLLDDTLQVALQARRAPPSAGMLALPGGYIHPQEDRDARQAAVRVLQEKAGIASPYLEQLATYSGARRDPRGWSVSIVYFALVPAGLLAPAPQGLQWRPTHRLPPLPFDHHEIIEHALARVRSKSQYSSLPVHLCAEPVTLPRLQAVYEAVLGEPLNKVSFRRKMDELGFLEPIEGELSSGAAHRPAQMYRLRPEFRRELSQVARGLKA